ncbi:ADP-ribose-binding protein [Hydrogenobacter hydrogenophilus]|uniref:O-acetyl-ADP-ribose deacetylase (Regulator of RNase III), contains Macro domain n=1 Tax=Hydrogenobacter hydrogenophilus TaxID=35835 RepID=A0A285NRT7_9AQUI|nr:ADP-ribose-binding protein [Hydrogenobacter hydrogenophilus]SNZ12240.1 O-acetyl-ADP-ribose deacetylase (regulator of RNase III), contains Macro domain [Hydrogenobacter hydrogenophilus]
MEIVIIEGSLLQVEADVIVNPANSLGYMGGGVAGVIKRAGGSIIEEEAVSKAPIPVGSAIITTAGSLPFKGVIHAPTMEEPAMATTEEKVRKALRASLELADKMGFKSIAIPGMGTGVGRLPKDIAAKAMIEEIEKFKPVNLEKVILVDVDKELVQKWREYAR